MDPIRDLENSFQKIEAKLASNDKAESISNKYSTDFERINNLYASEQDRYKIGLNERRDEILKELTAKRDQELNQVNEFIQNRHQISSTQLKSLNESIKLNRLVFARGISTAFESILFRSKLENRFKLVQLVKYSKLMRNKETVSLAKASQLVDITDALVHVLPLSRIFIFSSRSTTMLVLSKSGDVIHSRALKKHTPPLVFCSNYDLNVNATNILAHDEKDSTMQIYNFNLELVRSIEFDEICTAFKLNNYEIAIDSFSVRKELIIVCYNYKRAKTQKKICCLQIDEFKNLGFSHFSLVGLSDRFLFVRGEVVCLRHKYMPVMVLVLNRADDYSLFKRFKELPHESFIYNEQVFFRSGHLIAGGYETTIDVCDIDASDGERPLFQGIRGHMFRHFYSTSSSKWIYLKQIGKHDLTLELCSY